MSDGGGHEQLYLVVCGRATFTLDVAELDTPAGRFDPDIGPPLQG